MKRKFILFLSYFFIFSFTTRAQSVEVANLKFYVTKRTPQIFYYTFAAGDKVKIKARESKRKKFDIGVIESPSFKKNIKYTNVKISQADIEFTMSETDVIAVVVTTSSAGKKLVELIVERTPQSEQTKNFDTSVKYKTRYDTTWISYTKDSLVGYDTIPYTITKREKIKEEIREESILDRTEYINSVYNRYGNPHEASITFTIHNPSNDNEYIEEKILGWAFWISVDQQGLEAWNKNVNVIKNGITSLSGTITSPLGALVIGSVTSLYTPTSGEDIKWGLYYYTNQEYLKLASGQSIASYKKITFPKTGSFTFILENDNYVKGVKVNVKVSVVKKIEYYEDKEYQKYRAYPKYVKVPKKRMEIKKTTLIYPSNYSE